MINKKFYKNLQIAIIILWFISFIFWLFFMFINTEKENSNGMWISLSLMWLFLLLNKIIDKINKKNVQ